MVVMECEENSCDFELTLDKENTGKEPKGMELNHVTTKCVTLNKIGLMKPCNRLELGSAGNSPNSLDTDLNRRAHLIEETFESDDFDKADEFDSQPDTNESVQTNSKSIPIGKLKDDSVEDPSQSKARTEKLFSDISCNTLNKLKNTDDVSGAEMNSDETESNKHVNAKLTTDTSTSEKLVLQNGISCDRPNGMVHFNCDNNCTNAKYTNLASDDNNKNLRSKDKNQENCAQYEVDKIGSAAVNHKIHKESCIIPLLNGIDDTLQELPDKNVPESLSLPKIRFREETAPSPVSEDEIISNLIIEHEICDNSVDNQTANKLVDVLNGHIVPQTSKLTNTSNTDSPKRKLYLESSIERDDVSIKSTPNHTVQKCAKLDDIHSRINNIIENRIKENEEYNSSIEKKKKTSVNTARKHTSSGSPKVMKEIDQILRSELLRSKENISLVNMVNGDIADDVEKSNECAVNSSDEINHSRRENVSPCDKNYKIRLKTDMLDDDCLKTLFKIMRKRLTRRQLEEIMLQKCCEVISESSEIGELKKQVVELQQAEVFRKQTINSLEKQIHQLRGVCSVFMEKVKTLKLENRISTPTVITRSVGLQVAFDSSPYVRSDSSSSGPYYFEGGQSKNKSVTSVGSNKGTQDLIDKLLSSKMYPSPVSSPATNTTSVDSRASPAPSGSELNGKSSPQPDSSSNETLTSGPSSPLQSKKSNNITSTPADADTAIIDLTDKDDKNDNSSVAENTENGIQSLNSVSQAAPNNQIANGSRNSFHISRSRNLVGNSNHLRHPAPLPPTPVYSKQHGKRPPPTPELKLYKTQHGISLSWNMILTNEHADIAKYEINAYQETQVVAHTDLWKSVGTVDALPLPMACTLTQFVSGFTYHFSVRAVDIYQRLGPFSLAKSIAL